MMLGPVVLYQTQFCVCVREGEREREKGDSRTRARERQGEGREMRETPERLSLSK
jgi:hypothetical protein